MKVKITLTVGDCHRCPYLDVDFEKDTCYYCNHSEHHWRDGKICEQGKNGWDKMKSIKDNAKICPLRHLPARNKNE